MKYAVFAHIFGHLNALRAVFKTIDTVGVQHSVCLGNVVGNSKQPNECVAFLRERKVDTLLGSVDAVACGLAEPWGFDARQLQSVLYTRDMLHEENVAWLRERQTQQDFIEFSAIHGDPSLSKSYAHFEPLTIEHFPRLTQRYICFTAHPESPGQFPSQGDLRLNATGTCILHPDIDVYISPGRVAGRRKVSSWAEFGIFDSDSATYQQVLVPIR